MILISEVMCVNGREREGKTKSLYRMVKQFRENMSVK